MTLLWVILFLLHQGHTSVPVVTVQLGEPVTLTCALTEKFQAETWVHWYKQSAGNTLKLIVMLCKSRQTIYGQGFSFSRFNITYDGNKSSLIILPTIKQDEGMYHCGHMDWTESTFTGTYLALKENSQRTLSYTVVQESTLSDPASPKDSETLQCSVLFDSENPTCSGEPSVFWFRAISDTSYPDMIYTEGRTPENCEKTSDKPHKCSYNFSKDVRNSEAGTYYCAVATCGHILFGNRTNLVKSNQDINPNIERIVLVITLIFLAISIILNIIFVCCQTKRSASTLFSENSSSQLKHRDISQSRDETENGQDLNYAALNFSGGKAPRRKKRELKSEESVYSEIKDNVI
ncbi:uncharacterized protein V3H82_004737 isoform 1-T1 [Fundulus diaphanus]